jgi:hypothetical protein
MAKGPPSGRIGLVEALPKLQLETFNGLDFAAISTQIIEPFIAATWTPARVPNPKVREAAVVLRAKLLDAAKAKK